MAGRPGKKAQAQPSKPAFDEFADDTEGFEEDVPALDAKGNPKIDVIADTRSRDWRDVERYREARELRKLIGEDLIDEFQRPKRKTGKRTGNTE